MEKYTNVEFDAIVLTNQNKDVPARMSYYITIDRFRRDSFIAYLRRECLMNDIELDVVEDKHFLTSDYFLRFKGTLLQMKAMKSALEEMFEEEERSRNDELS